MSWGLVHGSEEPGLAVSGHSRLRCYQWFPSPADVNTGPETPGWAETGLPVTAARSRNSQLSHRDQARDRRGALEPEPVCVRGVRLTWSWCSAGTA